MKEMKRLMTMMAATLLALTACGNDLDVPKKKTRVDIPLTKAEAAMALSGNDFAYNLFRQAHTADPGKNIFISPISVSYAFSMLNNGAAGTTQKEIQQVLGLGSFSPEEINAYNQKMLVASRDLDPQVTLETANSIWVRQGLPVSPAFAEVNKSYYQAEVSTVDFSNPQTLGQINSWASKHTNGRIPVVLDRMDPNAVIYLLNALCFRGEWTDPFEKGATKEDIFTNADGSTSTVPMMNRSFTTLCFVSDTYKMITLPYGNGAFFMSVLLPDKGETTASIIADLSEAAQADLSKERTGYRVHLKLPRFSASYDIKLNDRLEALGMPSVFDPATADFSRLSSQPLFISEAFQKARIEVDEEGTKAEAVTVIEGTLTSPGPVQVPKLDFFVDRPFVYMIQEVSSGAVFFIGETNKL